jgi:RNA recognition motif-containing protein
MRIYIGNLYPGITEDELRQELVLFGKVTSIDIMNDKSIGSGQRRVCGFVEMATDDEGQAAIRELKEKPLKGRLSDPIVALRPSNKAKDNGKVSGFSRNVKKWAP